MLQWKFSKYQLAWPICFLQSVVIIFLAKYWLPKAISTIIKCVTAAKVSHLSSSLRTKLLYSKLELCYRSLYRYTNSTKKVILALIHKSSK